MFLRGARVINGITEGRVKRSESTDKSLKAVRITRYVAKSYIGRAEYTP